MMTYSLTKANHSQGFVLLTTLILLFMLTVLALTQVTLNNSQTRVATNATDTEITFEKSEGALNQALNALNTGLYIPTSFLNNANGLYRFSATATPLWQTINWNSSAAVINSFQGANGAQASFIIEKLPAICLPGQNCNTPANFYRITARTLGASGNSSVILQTTMQVH